MKLKLNESWIAGKYVIDNQKVEINTSLPYVSIEGYRIDYFTQGEVADQIIKDIHQIWLKGKLTQDQAIQKWINTYL